MSVIFRSLQKLKAQGGEDCRPALPFNSQRPIFRLGQDRITRLRIVSLVLLIILSGVGTAFGLYTIRSAAPEILQADDAAGRPKTVNDPRQVASAAFVPAPPRCDWQYLPAAKKGVDGRDGGTIRAAASPIPPDTASGRSGVTRATAKEIAVTVAAHPPGAVEPQPGEGAGAVDGLQGRPAVRRQKPPQQIAPQNVNRSLVISRLVNEIRSCMASAGCRQLDSLFDRLQALKGARNPYVLKLRGYWLLQQDQFESAAGLLQKVLIHDENDLEANINMAIAEMRLNRRQRARQRLARLREIYPDDAKLAEVWQQLN